MRIYPTTFCLLAVAWWTSVSAVVRAAEPPVLAPPARSTMGGTQFWADEFFFRQWRIQRNVLTGHYRLLDENDRRHAWGTMRQCRATLQRIRRDGKLPPMQGKAVIVLHGLFRSRSSMATLCRYLKEQGGYSVFNVGYPSTQRDVGSHARTLGRVIDGLDGIEEINFVAHSMGNIVVRHYLADLAAKRAASPTTTSPKVGRFVMLAPPNHGSLAALTFAESRVFKAIAGESGQQLGAQWAKLQGKLTMPQLEFGIIAGGKGDGEGYNPLLPGDDDATVSVASTRLKGASDFMVVPVLHPSIISNREVIECTLRFLKEGYFVSGGSRQPVGDEG